MDDDVTASAGRGAWPVFSVISPSVLCHLVLNILIADSAILGMLTLMSWRGSFGRT